MRYYGVNSFKFTNSQGRARFGRYQIVPAAGELSLPPEKAAGAGKDYLEQEIGQRLAAGPARFTLQVQLADEGDRIDDPSIAWPATRSIVKLGEITLTRVLPVLPQQAQVIALAGPAPRSGPTRGKDRWQRAPIFRSSP